MNIFVGNLSYETTDQDLLSAFSAFGTVDSASVIMDRFSGRSRGFGFVEMSNSAEAQKAISDLNGRDLGGRALTVNEARPRAAGGGGGVGGGRGGDRGGDRGGRRDSGPRW
ncbi:MAG: RNA-binding protein [Dehalococcoidia bacterium]